MSKKKTALDQMQAIKPRNFDIPAMMQRKSGAHTKSRKAKRQQDKVALKKELPFFMQKKKHPRRMLFSIYLKLIIVPTAGWTVTRF